MQHICCILWLRRFTRTGLIPRSASLDTNLLYARQPRNRIRHRPAPAHPLRRPGRLDHRRPRRKPPPLRRGESGLFFYDLLKQKLQDLNPGVVTPERADEVIHRLESVRNNIEGNSEILAWLRGERSALHRVRETHPQHHAHQLHGRRQERLPRHRGMAIHQRQPHQPGRRRFSDQRHPHRRGGGQERQEAQRDGGGAHPNPPLPQRDPRNGHHAPGVRFHPTSSSSSTA